MLFVGCLDVMVIRKKNIYFIVWIASWTSLLFHDIKTLLGENDWQIVLFSGLGARQIFSHKWMRLICHWRKKLTVSVPSDEIKSF